ncbi:tRNA lysidine(34) synthetase TilS [Oxalobacteraceae bacterium A2-2]
MKPQKPTLISTFEQAVSAALYGDALAIALSGGLDSSALLHLAQAYAAGRGLRLYAFHVHHGLSPNADAWLAHCEQACAALGVAFEARRVQLHKDGSGTEAAARKARYAALGEMCRAHGVPLLLTAHHQDDQAETVLLQLLRGSGTAGLSGMDTANTAPGLLGDATLMMARPLLSASRRQLEEYVAEHGIAHIHDESNEDTRYARNALRHQIMPLLEQSFPGFQERFARSAQHAQSAQKVLTEVAQQDLAHCLDGDCLALARLRELSVERSANLLRHWFATRGMRMPSAAWLHEMLAQLMEARHDAQLLVTHPDCHVRRHRDRLYLTPKLAELEGTREDQFDDKPGTPFRWNGEASLPFPAYGGVLHIEPAGQGEPGLPAAWLREQLLVIEFRKGGERLKLAPNRVTRPLKYHYQALDIPAWERGRLPVVSNPGQLLYAAGIGMDCKRLLESGEQLVRLRWQAS